jgi:hypothetical protein
VRGITFSAAFCCAYLWALTTHHPLFLYYPLHGDFRWGMQPLLNPQVSGPAMTWYGIVATAGFIAAVAALCIPRRLSGALTAYLWLFPLAAMLGCAFLLRRFF